MGKGKKHPADAQRAKEKEKQKKRNSESRKMVKARGVVFLPHVSSALTARARAPAGGGIDRHARRHPGRAARHCQERASRLRGRGANEAQTHAHGDAQEGHDPGETQGEARQARGRRRRATGRARGRPRPPAPRAPPAAHERAAGEWLLFVPFLRLCVFCSISCFRAAQGMLPPPPPPPPFMGHMHGGPPAYGYAGAGYAAMPSQHYAMALPGPPM